MEELKIGERATIILEAVEQGVCDGCFFYSCCNCIIKSKFKCNPESRSDGKSVIFKEVKE